MSGLGTSTRRPFDPAAARHSVFQALTQARREHGADTVALVDGDDRTFTYGDMILASFALGSALKRGTRAGECVGVMLPTGAAAALSFSTRRQVRERRTEAASLWRLLSALVCLHGRGHPRSTGAIVLREPVRIPCRRRR